jgi:hypothetical protein
MKDEIKLRASKVLPKKYFIEEVVITETNDDDEPSGFEFTIVPYDKEKKVSKKDMQKISEILADEFWADNGEEIENNKIIVALSNVRQLY